MYEDMAVETKSWFRGNAVVVDPASLVDNSNNKKKKHFHRISVLNLTIILQFYILISVMFWTVFKPRVLFYIPATCRGPVFYSKVLVCTGSVHVYLICLFV